MAFMSEMVDQLRDLLSDPTDTQVAFATKKLYLNRGIARLWPSVFRVVEVTLPIVADTYDYTIAAGAADGLITSVELATAAGATEFRRLDQYDLIVGDEDQRAIFRLGLDPGRFAGYDVRVRYVGPVAAISSGTYTAAQSEVWTGPDRALGLPVLYAMGMIAARKLDDRQDTVRYSTSQAYNGVTDRDIIGAAQTWFGQFESELLAMERPLPIARD